jgi:hypothetical protein
LYTPCVLGLRPSALFNEFLLIKKNRWFSKKDPVFFLSETLA